MPIPMTSPGFASMMEVLYRLNRPDASVNEAVTLGWLAWLEYTGHTDTNQLKEDFTALSHEDILLLAKVFTAVRDLASLGVDMVAVTHARFHERANQN